MKKSDLLLKIQSGNSDLLLHIDGFQIQIYLLHSYTANPNGQKSKVFYMRLFVKILKVDKIYKMRVFKIKLGYFIRDSTSSTLTTISLVLIKYSAIQNRL